LGLAAADIESPKGPEVSKYAPYVHPAWDHNQQIGANSTRVGQYEQQPHALVPIANGAPSYIMQAMAAVAPPAAPAVEVAQPTDSAGPSSNGGKRAKEKEGRKKRQPNWTLGNTK
jgi:hypothetical protein